MTSNELLYPSFVPEGCRECPSLSTYVENWRGLQSLQDIALSQLTDEGGVEFIAESMPPEIMRLIQSVSGDDTQLQTTEEKIDFFRRMNSDAFQGSGEAIEGIESEMQSFLLLCEDKKPLKVRIPNRHGQVIVKICSAALDIICDKSEHQVPVNIRREKPRQ